MNPKDVPFFEKVERPTSFKWPVSVPVPTDGRYVYATFTGVFRYKGAAEIDAWLKVPAGTAPRSDSDMAADVLIGVEDLKAADGTVLESTPELVAKVLAVDRAGPAVVTTFLAVSRGVAAEKNS
jgi:hypothetical protein